MKQIAISIDQAGRVVLPKSLRESYNLKPGDKLEVHLGDDYIILKPEHQQPGLVLEDGVWIHKGAALRPLANIIEEFRNERLTKLIK